MSSEERQNQIYVITPYPPPEYKEGEKASGLATYIQNVMETGMNSKRLTYIVDVKEEGPRSWKTKNDNNVVECWNKESKWAFLTILTKVSFRSNVFFNHDFGAYGGTFSAIITPIFLILLKLWARKVYTIQHSVITDLDEMSGHLGLEEGSFKSKIFSFGVRTNLILIYLISKKVIVLDQFLSDRYAELMFVNANYIEVINHPIYLYKPAKGQSEHIEQGAFNILFFGFLTWYKGADWIVKATESERWPTQAHLVMAGGKSVSQDHNSYYDNLKKKMEGNSKITHTGFLPDEDIPDLFTSCSLVILPYRSLMAASGPFAYALTYKKPFLISDKLEPYLKNYDFEKSMQDAMFSKDFFMYESENMDSFLMKLDNFMESGKIRRKAAQLSATLSKHRSLKSVQDEYEALIREIEK